VRFSEGEHEPKLEQGQLSDGGIAEIDANNRLHHFLEKPQKLSSHLFGFRLLSHAPPPLLADTANETPGSQRGGKPTLRGS